MTDGGLEEELKNKLLAMKERLEKDLGVFAKDNPHAAGGFETKWEDLGNDEESNVTEVEQYTSRVGVEYELEGQLREINAALEHIKAGTYGVCASCGLDINPARLKVKPEATLCINCSEKLQR